MASFTELQKQISELQQQAEQARKQEMSAALEQIRTLMREYNITEKDLKISKSKPSKAGGAVKYRDNDGNEWGGRGRQPHWLQGKNKDDYLVQ